MLLAVLALVLLLIDFPPVNIPLGQIGVMKTPLK